MKNLTFSQEGNTSGFLPFFHKQLLTVTLLLILFKGYNSYAQTLPYGFSQSSGSYTALTGGTSWQSGSTLATNAVSGSISIPFTFTFNGTGYTSLYISNNGFVTFGATTPATTTYNPLSASTAYAGAIAGYGFNLVNSAVSGAAPDISYGSVGTTPNREFVIQFTDLARTGITGDRLSFQIRLAETSNAIKIVYNNWAASTTTTTSTNFGVIGLRGASNTVYNARQVTATSPYNTWATSGASADNGSTPTQTALGSVGGADGANCVRYNSTYLPSNGLTYTWTPMATYSSLPYSQNFETWSDHFAVKDRPATNILTHPACGNSSWRNYNESTANSLWAGTSGQITLGTSQGSGAASFYNYGAVSGRKGYIDFYLNFSTSGTKSLSFDLINQDPGTVNIYLSTDGGLTFGSSIATYNTSISSWTTQTISSLSASTSSTCVIRFEASSTYGSYNIGIDNVSVFVNTPCTTPSTQPTSLSFSGQTATSIGGSFNAASPAPSGYLVLVGTNASAPTPVDGTSYTAGSSYTLGGNSYVSATITGSGPYSFTASGLTSNTQYYAYVYSLNNASCSGGPKYLTTSPLSGNTNTCPAAPTALAVTGGTITSGGATITWAAPAGGAVAMTYTLQYRINGAGGWTTASTAATSPYALSGLSASTTYDVQVFATNATCSGSAVSTNSLFTTNCANYSLTVTEGFESGSSIPACWSQVFVSGTKSFSYGTTTTAAGTSPNPAANSGNNRLLFPSYTNSGNQTRLISPPITTTGTSSVDVEFQWYFSTSGGSTSYTTEGVQLQWSTDKSTWTNVGSLVRRYGATTGWSLQTQTLPAGAGNQSTIYVGFLFTSNAGYDCFMDDIVIKATPNPCSTPSAQPTSLSFSGQTATSIGGSFNAASPAPSGYLVLVGTNASAPTPVDGTSYTAGEDYRLRQLLCFRNHHRKWSVFIYSQWINFQYTILCPCIFL
ncbi:MAG: choice-of-anchor J domain-containing protein [Chitinophagales bacterium]